MIEVDLLSDGRTVLLDDRTAQLGGSFHGNPLQVYSPAPLQWAYEQLSKQTSPVLLDVGASTGCYALLAALIPELTVWAFEPAPLTYQVLKENIRSNELQKRVNYYPIAISNYEGFGVAHIPVADNQKGIAIVDGTPASHKATEPVPVRVVTLDGFCRRNSVEPTLIKVDCEGGELYVLKGASGIIEKYRPMIIAEYSQENCNQYGLQASALTDLLESWGYIWSNPTGTDILAIPPKWDVITDTQNMKRITS